MSDTQNSSCSSSTVEERKSTPEILISETDERFFQSLCEFVEREKQYQQCPDEGPDELRYLIYRSVFDKVIGRASDYQRLLLTIKVEYDNTIRELQRKKEEARTRQQAVTAVTSQSKSVRICQRRAAQLRDSIFVLQQETTELQKAIKTQKSLKEQSTWIPGLTVAESEDPEALHRHMKRLEAQRAALLDERSRCVPVELKMELDTKLQAAEHQRDQLSSEQDRLKALYKRLRFVRDHLSCWEKEGQKIPLEELLGSALENIRQTNMMDDDSSCNIDAELLEGEEPLGFDGSQFLTDYLHRFIELFDSAQFEDAALHAARSPRGVLRNLNTMDMFGGVQGPPGSLPPLVLFSQALLLTAAAGDKLSAPLSLRVVRCVLQHGDLRLVAHAITQNKLTTSEDVGDLLIEYAQNNPSVADTCLALATVVFEACRLNRKAALSMCRRGLIHSTAEFMNHCNDFTADDCMWVLHRSPSVPLLQLLTEPQQGRAAILSVGLVCSTLLAEPKYQDLALQLLDSFNSQGRGVLEEVILEDCSSSVDLWTSVASLCSGFNRADLSQAILSVLLDQSGTRLLSPDLEGAQLVEHILM